MLSWEPSNGTCYLNRGLLRFWFAPTSAPEAPNRTLARCARVHTLSEPGLAVSGTVFPAPALPLPPLLGRGGDLSRPPEVACDRPDFPDCPGSLPPMSRAPLVSWAARGFRQRNGIPQADSESAEISLFPLQLLCLVRGGRTQSGAHGVTGSTRRHAPLQGI